MNGAFDAPIDTSGAHNYALQLAKYINDESTISAAVKRNFGFTLADCSIRDMLKQRRDAQAKRRKDAAKPIGDGSDWRPRGIVQPPPPTPPASALNKVVVDPVGKPVEAAFVRPPLPRELVNLVCLHFKMDPAQVTGGNRAARYRNVRSLIACLLRDRGMSLNRIGFFLGGRDHSTVANSLAKFDYYATRDRRLMTAYKFFGGKSR